MKASGKITGLLILLFLLSVASAQAMSAGSAQGRPIGAKGPRYELWKDKSGWHLRWTGSGRGHHFEGRLHAPGGEIIIIRKVSKEENDRIWRKGKTIHINARASAGFDGLDFQWRGRELVVELTIDGISRPGRIFVGKSMIHPQNHPFVITRYQKVPKGKVWVPGHYGPRGRWIPGHWR